MARLAWQRATKDARGPPQLHANRIVLRSVLVIRKSGSGNATITEFVRRFSNRVRVFSATTCAFSLCTCAGREPCARSGMLTSRRADMTSTVVVGKDALDNFTVAPDFDVVLGASCVERGRGAG